MKNSKMLQKMISSEIWN